MTIGVTMTGTSGLRMLDHRAILLCSHKTGLTLPFLALNSLPGTQKRYLNIYFPHGKPQHILIRQNTSKLSCKDLGIVRYMSAHKEPPHVTEETATQSTVENSDGVQRPNSNGFNNMMNLVKERSSELQAFGKQLSEKSTSVIARITPETQASPILGQSTEKKEKLEDWNDILNRWYRKYQDFIGITDMKKAQDRVTELSEGLLGTQSRRRILQAELEELQEQLNINHQRITKAELYSEEHYRLFDQARDMNGRVKEVRTEFESCERLERDTFTQLSAAIRDCHERERTQAEQSKYWSIIASIVSAALASVFTSVNNWVRIREIKDHVSANNKSLLEGYQKMHEDIVLAVNAGMTNTVAVVTENNKSLGKDEEAGVKENPILKSTLEPTALSLSSQVKLCEEDIMLLGKTFGESVMEVMPGLLAEERKAIEERILPQFDAIFRQLNTVIEGNQALMEFVSSVKREDVKESLTEEMAKSEVVPLPSSDIENTKELTTVVVEYSYKHIASAMAVGAGIGTLATAFLLGSFSGGSV